MTYDKSRSEDVRQYDGGIDDHQAGSFISSFGSAVNADTVDIPDIAVNVMTEKTALYECLDRAQAYSDAGTGEYWLIDMDRQFVYVFCFHEKTYFRRYTFEQTVSSSIYPGFRCCISQVMWEDSECLRDLSVFYRFRKELEPGPLRALVAEEHGIYTAGEPDVYTAAMFREWLKTRRQLPEFAEMTELLLGGICPEESPGFRHQFIQGNLYFAVKTYLREHPGLWQLCFSPMAVEMTGKGILDSVLRPDLFIVPESENIDGNIYRGTPPWIVEIADPSSAARDYMDKEQIYSFHGVSEYWIINGWKRQVLVMKFSGDGYKEIFSYDDIITPDMLPGLEIRMSEVLEI